MDLQYKEASKEMMRTQLNPNAKNRTMHRWNFDFPSGKKKLVGKKSLDILHSKNVNFNW